jgi:hypothetical protein
MNELLREIAIKAQVEHCISHVRLQEFAELIIQEAASLVEGFELTQEVALDEYVDYEASSVLKEHFGVK